MDPGPTSIMQLFYNQLHLRAVPEPWYLACTKNGGPIYKTNPVESPRTGRTATEYTGIASLTSEDSISPEVLVVEKVSHYSIELSWRTVQGDRSGPNETWTSFALEQMSPKTQTYSSIYIGYSTHHIVENLEPCTLYWFRLKISKPNGECCVTPAFSASTSKEPMYGSNVHFAVNHNDEEELNKVLQSGKVNLNICDKLGLTPLMVAAQYGFSRIVHILVKHGADIHMKNGSGKDALMMACFSGHLDIVNYLRKVGATWKSKDVNGCTPLHWAVDGGHIPVVEFMIQDGCELDMPDTLSHWTPLLRVSAVSGNSGVASLLIQAGADLNFQDKDGKTPLMLAVINNHDQLVKLLLDSGADWNVRNEFGSGAPEMATALAKKSIIKMFEERNIYSDLKDNENEEM